MTEQESKKQISYVKPEALDLGSVAPIMGFPVAGSCVDGGLLFTDVTVHGGTCAATGNAAGDCGTGNSPLKA